MSAVYHEPLPGSVRPPRTYWSASMSGPGRSGLYVEHWGSYYEHRRDRLHRVAELPSDAVDLVPGVRPGTPEPGPVADRWMSTCPECSRPHATREQLAADPVGTWRQLWRGDEVAVRWHVHPCDTPARPWKVFTAWGVDEVPDVAMQESHRIPAPSLSPPPSRCAYCRSAIGHAAVCPVVDGQPGPQVSEPAAVIWPRRNGKATLAAAVFAEAERVAVPVPPPPTAPEPKPCRRDAVTSTVLLGIDGPERLIVDCRIHGEIARVPAGEQEYAAIRAAWIDHAGMPDPTRDDPSLPDPIDPDTACGEEWCGHAVVRHDGPGDGCTVSGCACIAYCSPATSL